MNPPPRITFLGVSLDPWTMEETVSEIGHRLDRDEFTQHVVVNVAKIVNMRNDPNLRDSVISCDIINVDGMGVRWGARFLGLKIPERVAGIDLFDRLLELASVRRESVFLLGAKPDVLEGAVRNLQSRFPRLSIAGWHHGYFDRQDEKKVVETIRNSGARLLFVAISSPKKERFINEHRHALGVRFAMGVGGTFDIVAGKTKRAPQWMQNAGLEWFFRVLQEPRRMWKRYLVTNAKYAWLLAKEMLVSALARRGRAP